HRRDTPPVPLPSLRAAPASHRTRRAPAAALAHETSLGAQFPFAASPVEGADNDRVGVCFVEVQPTCLAEAPRPRLSESRRDGDDRRAGFVACDLELVSLAHSSLVDVSGEDEVCTCVDEAAE